MLNENILAGLDAIKTEDAVAEARRIMEDKDTAPGAMTVGYEEESYTLTGEEMHKIALALYLADLFLYELRSQLGQPQD